MLHINSECGDLLACGGVILVMGGLVHTKIPSGKREMVGPVVQLLRVVLRSSSSCCCCCCCCCCRRPCWEHAIPWSIGGCRISWKCWPSS